MSIHAVYSEPVSAYITGVKINDILLECKYTKVDMYKIPAAITVFKDDAYITFIAKNIALEDVFAVIHLAAEYGFIYYATEYEIAHRLFEVDKTQINLLFAYPERLLKTIR